MKRRYAMAREGNAFIQDGLSISWPQGGKRDVVELDDADLNGQERFKIRIATGSIVEVEDEATVPVDMELPYALYEGADAKVIAAQPAPPVVIRRRQRDGSTRETVLKPLGRIENPKPETPAQITPVAKTNLSRRRG